MSIACRATLDTAIRALLPNRHDPRWSWSAPFPLGLSDFNVYGSASTKLPAGHENDLRPVMDNVTLTTTNKLAGTVGTEDVAAAALLPQPTALTAMRILLTNIPAVIFSISNVLLLVLGATLLSKAPPAAEWRRSLFFNFVLPVTVFEAVLFLLTMLLASVPILQAQLGVPPEAGLQAQGRHNSTSDGYIMFCWLAS